MIDGERRRAVAEAEIDQADPGKGQVLTRIAGGRPANDDLPSRARNEHCRTGGTCGRLLDDLGRFIEEHAEELAIMETLDNGKRLSESPYADTAPTAQTC